MIMLFDEQKAEKLIEALLAAYDKKEVECNILKSDLDRVRAYVEKLEKESAAVEKVGGTE